MNKSIADIRTDYRLLSFDEKDADVNPIKQFSRWWDDAITSKVEEVNAMALATSTKNGKPSARIVLLKDFDDRGFVFFTNYQSHKGQEISENPFAALVFFWKEIERQIRIEGCIQKTSAEESNNYFSSRPPGSRISAWSSPQSQVIKNRDVLNNNAEKFTSEFQNSIPRPSHWGGYRVMPQLIEFWQGRSNRLHDRLQYTKTTNGSWKVERLAP